jgi:excisionase family DNA binding protein
LTTIFDHVVSFESARISPECGQNVGTDVIALCPVQRRALVVQLEDINTLEQTAEYLKLTEYQVKQLAYKGKLGYIKAGNTRTFPREAIEAYVRDNIVPPKPSNPHGLTDASWRRIARGGGLRS